MLKMRKQTGDPRSGWFCFNHRGHEIAVGDFIIFPLRNMKYFTTILSLSFLLIFSSCSRNNPHIAEGLKYKQDGTTHVLEGKDFNAILAQNEDGSWNAVIEIPAGTIQKWEVYKDGRLHWDIKHGEVRYVDYIPYPGNYGMIPQTMAGDGDPVDVVILGPARPRGTVAKVRIIGVMKALDGHEQDDKFLAVFHPSELSDLEKERTHLHEVENLEELNTKYPGVASIMQTWFEGYKRKKSGKPKMKVLGFESVDGALNMLQAARAQ